MLRRAFYISFGLLIGLGIGFLILPVVREKILQKTNSSLYSAFEDKKVIGFLPYWLLSNAKIDYSPYITQLSYFGLRVDSDGSILKLNNPQEREPGWNALISGKLDSYFDSARKHGVSLSLLVASGDSDAIETLISDPQPHAVKLVNDITPILSKYNFSDLNLDIEYTKRATDEARQNFTIFTKTVRRNLDPKYTLTVEITGDDLIKNNLTDVGSIAKIADYIVIMAYDFHYPGSFVTGAVAPLTGAVTTAEYDVTAAVEKGLEKIPQEKIILGIPTYGYEWETLQKPSRSAVIPGTGIAASNRRAEEFISKCSTCSAIFDITDQEEHVVYEDKATGTIHQMFYPTKKSTQAKINLANNESLGGIAIWALGYEGNSILDPLKNYK